MTKIVPLCAIQRRASCILRRASLLFLLLQLPACKDSPSSATYDTNSGAPAQPAPAPTTCFARGTHVATPQGLVPIEEIAVGDVVQSFEFSTGEVVSRPVTAIFAHPPARVITLASTNGVELLLTPEHPVYSTDTHSFVRADSHLGGGNALALTSLWTATVEPLGAPSAHPASVALLVDVFDISVADTHNFFANGILVHNKQIPNCPSGVACPSDEIGPGPACGATGQPPCDNTPAGPSDASTAPPQDAASQGDADDSGLDAASDAAR